MTDELTIKDLIDMRNRDNVHFIDEFSRKSSKWRSAYRDIKTAMPETLTWYKDKNIKGPVSADSVDVLIYLKPNDYSSVILFRTANKKAWKSMLQDCSDNFKESTIETNHDIKLHTFKSEDVVVQMAEGPKTSSCVVINAKDYNAGLRIE